MFNRLIRAVPAVACLALAACGPLNPPGLTGEGTTTAPRAPHSGGILRLGQAAADLESLDPDYATATQDRALVDMVFNALIRYTPGDATSFEPDLATTLPAPTTDASGRQVWTFPLRRGVSVTPTVTFRRTN